MGAEGRSYSRNAQAVAGGWLEGFATATKAGFATVTFFCGRRKTGIYVYAATILHFSFFK